MSEAIASTQDTPQSFLKQRVAIFCALATRACTHAFIFVSLPLLGRQLGFSDMQTGMLISIPAFLMILSGPFWGIYSDRKGRRPIIVTGMIAASVSPLVLSGLLQMRHSSGMATWLIYIIFLITLMIQVTLSAGFLPAVQAWLADSTEKKERVKSMAFLTMSYGFGSISGSSLTWAIGGSKYQILTLCLCSGVLFLSGLGIQATLPKGCPPVRKIAPQRKTSLRKRFSLKHASLLHIWPFLTITAVGMTVFSILVQVLPLRLVDEFGLSQQAATGQSGKIMMLTMLISICVQAIFTRRSSLHPATMLLLGTFITVICMLCATFTTSVPMLTTAIAFLGVGIGILGPGNLALLSLKSPLTGQAQAAGTNVVAKGLGMILGPIIGAALHQITPELPFLCGTFSMLLVCALAFYIRKHSIIKT